MTEESLKTGLKIHKGKAEFMTNIDTTDNTQINGTEMEKLTSYTYLGQTKAEWSVLESTEKLFWTSTFP